MPANEIITAMITGGVGATIGSIATATIQSLSGRAKSRAEAADLITGASNRIINRLEIENKSMREAIVLLTEINDEIVWELKELGADEALTEKLRKINRSAKLSLSVGEVLIK